MNLKRRSVLGMLTGAGSVVVKTALGVIIIPVLIARLGVPLYGLYVLLVGVLDIAAILDLGFTASLIKILGTQDAMANHMRKNEVLLVGLWFYTAMSLLALGVGLLFISQFVNLFHIPFAYQALTRQCLLIILLEAALTLYALYYRSILLSHNLHVWTNLAESIFGITANLAGVVVLLMGWGLPALLGVRVLSAMLRLGIQMAQTLRVERLALKPPARFNLQTTWDVLTLSCHAMMINLSVTVSHKIDNFVIARFMPLEAVGVFEIVFRFLGIVLQVMGRVCEVALPLFSRLLASAQTESVQKTFIRFSALSNFLVAQMLLFIVVFYPQLFHVFSAGRIPIGPTLPILAVAVPTVWSGVLQMPAGYYLFTANRQRLLSVSSLITAACNFILSIILIHYFGLIGVALGTLIPQVIQHQIFLIGATCRELNIPVSQYIWQVHCKMLLPLLAAALVMFGLRPLADVLHPVVGTSAAIGLLAFIAASFTWYLTGASQADKALIVTALSRAKPVEPVYGD